MASSQLRRSRSGRATSAGWISAARRRLPQEQRGDPCADSRRCAEGEERCRGIAVRRKPRDTDGRSGAADRHGGLTDPEREPSLFLPEPAHDSSSARGVDARPECAEDDEEADERGVAHGERDRAHRDPGTSEPEPDHGALADPVCEQSPRQERRDHAERDRSEHDPHLAEREVVMRAQHGGKHRQADERSREARLGEGARGEDHPPVAAHSAASARSRISFVFRISLASGPRLSGPAVSSTAGRPCSRG